MYACVHAQVRHKFLQCVTVTCFYLAAKLEEDTEVSLVHLPSGALSYISYKDSIINIKASGWM